MGQDDFLCFYFFEWRHRGWFETTPKAGFFPLFLSIRAAILFKFTAIAVSLACMDMLRRPQPLARTNP
jgi:hypothetical protein